MITKTEYNRVHKWVARNLKKIHKCFYCETRTWTTQWSNIDHQYRQIPEEWQELCPKCHRAYDREVLGVKPSTGRPKKIMLDTLANEA